MEDEAWFSGEMFSTCSQADGATLPRHWNLHHFIAPRPQQSPSVADCCDKVYPANGQLPVEFC